MQTILTVAQLNRMAHDLVEASPTMSDVAVCGEITNFVRHYKSGHCYFSLRDADATIKSVLFSRQAKLIDFAPQDGMMVLAYGRASIYERDGAFQFYVNFMRPYGVGAAQLAFDRLKEKLGKEGLFAPERKKKLPQKPGCIGVVTSKTGAALQDILNVVGRRWPLTKLLLAPVTVQGLTAEPQIVRGIQTLDADPRVDVIIVARGGGSREDLWVFNGERIARAAAACATPLVSAVGHEIDYSILDYVADLRAPTPSAAAELCVPDRAEALNAIFILQQNIQDIIHSRLNLCYNKLEIFAEQTNPARLAAHLQTEEQQLELLSDSVSGAMQTQLNQKQRVLAQAAALAGSLSPYHVLARGYALVEDENRQIQTPDGLKPGDRCRVVGSKTAALCDVVSVETLKGETQ